LYLLHESFIGLFYAVLKRIISTSLFSISGTPLSIFGSLTFVRLKGHQIRIERGKEMKGVFTKEQWFGNIRGDVLAGIVVALALIPEAIAFSIIAGVDPMVGLYASFCIAVVISFVGGRPGMISAATGAMALLMVTLVADHGLQYLFAATILTGILQIIAGVFKLAKYMKFIPRSVMVGFVNALAILIFMAGIFYFLYFYAGQKTTPSHCY